MTECVLPTVRQALYMWSPHFILTSTLTGGYYDYPVIEKETET